MDVKEWAEKGQIISVLNTDIFIIDEGNSDKTLVILHGYATSSIDYYKVLPELSKHFRVIIQDFAGFGFSDKPKKYYLNVLEQADVTLRLWDELELKNITLLSHNYGTSIALEILTRNRSSLIDVDLQNLIFLNSTISFDHKNESEEQLNPLQEFSKRVQLMFTSFSFYKMKMKDFFFDADTILESEIKARWTLNDHKEGQEIIDFLSNYKTESKILWNRWFTSLNKNTLYAKIICGKNDIIFDENEATRFAEELRNSSLHFIDNCGHYPMLEKPEELIALILKEEN